MKTNTARRQAWAFPPMERLGYMPAELGHRIGYSPFMNWIGANKARALPRSVALREELCAVQGVTGDSIRLIGG